MSDSSLYNKEFIDEALNAKAFLQKTKNLHDDFDMNAPSTRQQIDFIEQRRQAIFSILDKHFFNTWGIARDFSQEELRRHQKYYQSELLPFFLLSPYNRRVCEKPLGYPGDYLMMLYLYQDGYEGESTFAKLIHRYSLTLPIARANHNRKSFYKKQIVDCLDNNISPAIASIACGPAMEILEVLSEYPAAAQASFTCLDFEKQALDYVKEQVAGIEKNKSQSFKVNYVNANIRTLLSPNRLNSALADQDLIYSSGLIDYFNDKTAAKIIELLFSRLKNNGVLIVGNVSDKDRHRAFTELLGEWYINYRNENDMRSLAKGLHGDFNLQIDYEKETKMNIYLIIRKHT